MKHQYPTGRVVWGQNGPIAVSQPAAKRGSAVMFVVWCIVVALVLVLAAYAVSTASGAEEHHIYLSLVQGGGATDLNQTAIFNCGDGESGSALCYVYEGNTFPYAQQYVVYKTHSYSLVSSGMGTGEQIEAMWASASNGVLLYQVDRKVGGYCWSLYQ